MNCCVFVASFLISVPQTIQAGSNGDHLSLTEQTQPEIAPTYESLRLESSWKANPHELMRNWFRPLSIDFICRNRLLAE